ncbi:MAG: acyl carrier protein [Acidimicrobiia bacterium]|nr:acyl carrier protein [Acidimicrobiia bacterium]
MTTDAPLAFDEFVRRVAEALDLEPEEMAAGARFDEDLGLDSYDLVELLTLVEELGARLPDDVAVGVQTVGDLYREYEQRAAPKGR